MEKNGKIEVLDKGFVRFVDRMGTDIDVEQAARISYDKGTRPVSDTNNLIRFLMRHEHTGPFEQVEFKFHIKCPLYVFGQIVRHRTANLNVRSYRYSEFDEEFNYLPRERYVTQSKDNKQGSGTQLIFNQEDFDSFQLEQEGANTLQQTIYEELLEDGCAREIARIHLPQSAYTEFFWKCDLRNLLHFLKLRLAKNAQLETRQYAQAISYFVQRDCPLTWRAFEDYVLNAVTLTRKELNSIRLARTSMDELIQDGYSKREAQELLDKLEVT